MRLAAALELARRVSGGRGYPSPYLKTPGDVFDITADLRLERREHFVGLYLNTRNRLLARETISVGSLNASIVHPREVFEPAVRRGAATVIVVHNHPSGETEPSEDDVSITQRLNEAGEILGITLLDHVIVGTGGFTSMKETQHL
jgi:DNA repair protein RadC